MKRLLTLALAVALSTAAYGEYQATIVRDKFGVPHISGNTEADAAFGFGYAQAEDRLEPILRNYLKACGREASVFGSAYLESDIATHHAGIPECVAEHYDSLDPAVKAYIEGFAAGIAYYMKTHADKVPSWAKPPTPQDVLTLPKYWLMQPSISAALSEGRRLPPLPEKKSGGDNAKRSGRCNAWAIGKSKSRTGHAMLQMDQHMPYVGPMQWYEAHLRGGSLNVVGATTFGNPFLLIGHNEHYAWTMTANSPDTADVYFEKMNPEDRNQYEYDGAFHPIEIRKIKLGVKQGDEVEEREIELKYTRHGPVFLHTHEKIYSAKYSDAGHTDFALQYYRINTAKSVDEFKDAMRLLGIPRGNYICADDGGNIYYVYNARVYRKSPRVNWSGPVPGWTTETEWGELIPFDELPQESNPEGGFLQNCNDGPMAVAPDSEIDTEDLPAYIGRDLRRSSPGTRGERATTLLEKAEKLTFAQFKAIAMDNHSAYLIRWKTRFIDDYIIQEDKGSEKVEQAMKLLKEWDGNLTADNVAMMFYKIWRMEMRGGTVPKGRGGTMRALERAADEMMKLYGRLDVKWGPHHVIKRGDKTFPVATGGTDAQTLFVASASSLQDGKWICTSGSSYMMSVELSTPPRSVSIFPLGMSDDPASPHFTDMTALYAKGRYKPVWFTEEDIAANKEKEYIVECK